MRLTSLRARRYGCFEDLSLQFGPEATVVFGANESGKSTLLDALGDFLWGIRSGKHPRAYIYAPSQMVLEGCVEDAGASHTWSRRLGKVTDEAQPDAEPPWNPDGTSIASAWKNSFGLNLDQLQDGGREVIAGHGDLADLIFLAETGLVIDRVRQALASRTSSIYKDRRNASCEVRTLIAEIESLEARARDSEASATDVSNLRERIGGLESSRQRLSALWQAFERTRRRQDELNRGYGPAATLREAEAELDALRAIGPTLGRSQTDSLAAAIEDLSAAMATIDRATREAHSAETRRSAMKLNPGLLEAETSITKLQENLAMRRADQALVAGSHVGDSLRESTVTALRKLGHGPGVNLAEDIAVLTLSDSTRDQIRRLAEALSQGRNAVEEQELKIQELEGDVVVAEFGDSDRPGQALVEARRARDDAWRAVRTPWVTGELPEQPCRESLAAKVDEAIGDTDRTAESRTSELAAAAHRRGEALERERRLALERLALQRMGSVKAAAAEEWATFIAKCGLPDGMDTTAWAIHDNLLIELDLAWRKYEAHTRELEDARSRLCAFAGEVATMAALAGESHEDPVRQVEALVARLNAAREARTQATEIDARLAELAASRADADLQRTLAESTIGELTEGIGEPTRELLERSTRRASLRDRVAELTARVRAAKEPDSDISELLVELASVDPAVIEAGRREAADRSNELKEQLDEVSGELVSARKDLSDLEARGSAAQLRSVAVTHGEVLRSLIEEYQHLRIQVELLDAFSRQLADTTESPMLDDAGRYLARLTAGRYVGFDILEEGDGRRIEVLFTDPENPDGSPTSVGLGTLSEGTADQVFLALRLAGVRSRQEQRKLAGLPTLPVVLDDVLMAHDDERARAALEVVAEVAADMQIILLTHHRSVLDSALGTPGIETVELEPAGVSGGN